MKLMGLHVPFTERKADLSEITLDEFFRLLGSYGASKSGIVVNTQSALTVTTLLACASRKAQALTVPLKIKKRNVDGSRVEVRKHPLYRVFSQRPNSVQTPFEFREMMGFHLSVRGNFYAIINRVNNKIDELVPMIPEQVSVSLNSDQTIKKYRYKIGGENVVELDPSEVWHVKGPSWSLPAGLDMISVAKETIALSLASQDSMSRAHQNGLRETLVFSTEKSLDEKQLARMSAMAQIQYEKTKKAGGGIIAIDKGAKISPFGYSSSDSQLVEGERFQVEQVCRAMEVLPIMVGHADKTATYASAEAMFLAHLVHTVRPFHDRIASSIDRWLLTEEEQDEGYYSQFVEEAFLSPAMKDKAEYRKIALGGGGNPGWLTPNEVRDHDDLKEIEGGNFLYAQTQLGPIGPDGIPKAPTPPAAAVPPKTGN